MSTSIDSQCGEVWRRVQLRYIWYYHYGSIIRVYDKAAVLVEKVLGKPVQSEDFPTENGSIVSVYNVHAMGGW